MIRNPHSPSNITISREEYDRLEKRSEMLRYLEAGGVDNWKWYSESLQPFWKKYYPEEYE